MSNKTFPRSNQNPASELMEIAKQHGLNQFRIKLQRRNKKGTLQNLEWMNLAPEQLSQLDEIVDQVHGGGDFEAYIYHPVDGTQCFYSYTFSNAGPPKPNPYASQQESPMWPYGQNPGQSPFPYTTQYHPLTGAPLIPQQFGPSYPPVPFSFNASPNSPNEERLRTELDNLRKEMHRRDMQLEQERQRAEADRREQALRLEISNTNRRMEELMREVKDKVNGGGAQQNEALFSMISKLQENQQSALTRLAEREIQKNQQDIDREKTRMEAEFSYRKEVMNWIQQANDPSKQFEVFSQMGQQTANMLNLIVELGQSGLMDKAGDEPPPWLSTVNSSIEAFKDFLKDRSASNARNHQQAVRGFANIGYPQGPQGPSTTMPPRFPQGQQRPVQGPVQPQIQTQAPQKPLKPASEIEDDEIEIPDRIKPELQAIGQSMFLREDPEMVATMVYNICDYSRFFSKLYGVPRGWENVFVDPKSVIVALIRKQAPNIKIDDEYLDIVCSIFLQFEADFEAGQPTNAQMNQGADDNPGISMRDLMGSDEVIPMPSAEPSDEDEEEPSDEEPGKEEKPEKPAIDKPKPGSGKTRKPR